MTTLLIFELQKPYSLNKIYSCDTETVMDYLKNGYRATCKIYNGGISKHARADYQR